MFRLSLDATFLKVLSVEIVGGKPVHRRRFRTRLDNGARPLGTDAVDRIGVA
jgi:hypothetical protein